ncbi:hypothetical protein BLA29_013041 [Euroglyphus maynei]|uniref:Uncharacterized protein n=1 Tax=Euroglyphus maynei TaxID=6958 RepID=A0A1Y3BHT8_EURMA|nr:hypothetical protein BLA29_013041 [Euroglyphus maynei]
MYFDHSHENHWPLLNKELRRKNYVKHRKKVIQPQQSIHIILIIIIRNYPNRIQC